MKNEPNVFEKQKIKNFSLFLFFGNLIFCFFIVERQRGTTNMQFMRPQPSVPSHIKVHESLRPILGHLVDLVILFHPFTETLHDYTTLAVAIDHKDGIFRIDTSGTVLYKDVPIGTLNDHMSLVDLEFIQADAIPNGFVIWIGLEEHTIIQFWSTKQYVKQMQVDAVCKGMCYRNQALYYRTQNKIKRINIATLKHETVVTFPQLYQFQWLPGKEFLILNEQGRLYHHTPQSTKRLLRKGNISKLRDCGQVIGLQGASHVYHVPTKTLVPFDVDFEKIGLWHNIAVLVANDDLYLMHKNVYEGFDSAYPDSDERAPMRVIYILRKHQFRHLIQGKNKIVLALESETRVLQ